MRMWFACNTAISMIVISGNTLCYKSLKNITTMTVYLSTAFHGSVSCSQILRESSLTLQFYCFSEEFGAFDSLKHY